jgi:hypothetical protein
VPVIVGGKITIAPGSMSSFYENSILVSRVADEELWCVFSNLGKVFFEYIIKYEKLC